MDPFTKHCKGICGTSRFTVNLVGGGVYDVALAIEMIASTLDVPSHFNRRHPSFQKKLHAWWHLIWLAFFSELVGQSAKVSSKL